ncbi:hypothetical protein LDK18_05495 [Fusobacterium nucleatum subsp. nucleatum ATCC 23726]|uniref:Uncharacterized protein n=1 Tax=Fusobacterium nucleatum subsp. nucleatum (strain ATCC 23726 / VPI 4351) TaxID=525283 RepID=D5RAT6_FUSN2|nr:hypothetical protein [Fusobacterium nucleatum]EFG96179.1 hypothetical protein HMPREF0397_0321 [Fusobacterium nucleatum subsp. nucleatum ATCC 23726]
MSSNYIDPISGKSLSIEEVLEENKTDEDLQNIIYLYYYHKILKIGYLEEIEKNNLVFQNYQKFLENLIKLLQRENYQK